MTMKAILVNAGNRTGDKLKIQKVSSDGIVTKEKTMVRGEAFNIYEFAGNNETDVPDVRITIMYNGADDKYVDNPQVVVVDKPEYMLG